MASDSAKDTGISILVGVLYSILLVLILWGVDRWIREVIREEIPACRCEKVEKAE